MEKIIHILFIVSVTILMTVFDASAFRKRISGVVADSVTGERISLVNIYLINEKKGFTSDKEGSFHLIADNSDSVRFSSSGYSPRTVSARTLQDSKATVCLIPSSTTLDEFIVYTGKRKYSKKNNPAFDLMKKVRNCIKITDPRKEAFYSYDTYERITLGLNDFTIPGDIYSTKYGFVSDYADTAINTGLPVMLISVKEKTFTSLFSTSPNRSKIIITGDKSDGIDKAFDQENISKMLRDVLREPDIFSNDIKLIQNRFVSPLSDIAGDFYRYYLSDTVVKGPEHLLDLSFAPNSPESFGFNGHLTIGRRDSLYYVKEVEMRVPRLINLNFIDNIFIRQKFELDSIGKLHKTLDEMSLELQLVSGTQSFYAARVTGRKDFTYEKNKLFSDYYDKLGHNFVLDESQSRPDYFWNQMRVIPLSKAEANMGSLIGRMRKFRWFYWTEKILSILVQGYVEFTPNSKFDFGPVNTLVSYNTTEGVRVRIGGLTTTRLNKHIFGKGYVAYGFRDRKWKYNAEIVFSFNEKKNNAAEFPVHSITLAHKYDIDMLGQHYLFTNADNIFLSLKRKDSWLATYQRLSRLEYNLELNNNFSFTAGLRHEIQESTPWVPFITTSGDNIKRFSQARLYIKLRYAPGEEYVQTKTTRLPVNMDAPVFQLTHEFGPKKILGSDFTINKTEISIFKRLWFSAFGYADIILKGGKIWSQVQYPALMWQNSNLSYTIQPESYSLMNPMEFANDYYGSLDFTYWINGAILNRVPIIKKLKLREVFTFKMLMGGLTKKNNPQFNPGLFKFPDSSHTSSLTKTPYMEIGCGLDNIFKILRIDYVWRLTYLSAPDIDKNGLRISLHFSF